MNHFRAYYADDDLTIISNCDTYVYLGCNDIKTAESISIRTDKPLSDILYMPVGKNWIFRRGELPVFSDNFDLDSFMVQIYAEQNAKNRKDEKLPSKKRRNKFESTQSRVS